MPYPYDADDLEAIGNLASFYNGDDYDPTENPGGFGHGGHRVNFIPSLRDVATVGEAVADAADAAALYSNQASNYATALVAFSTSGVAIGTGTKTFTTQSGKQFVAGQWVQISSNATPTNWMHGQITSYSGTTLVVDVTQTSGSGSFNDWQIGVSAPRGPTGLTGATGPASLAGLLYTFSTNTASSDPGAGFVKINNASPASATAVYISETDANAVGVSALIASWDDSTSTVKGTLTIVQNNDPSKFMSWQVTGTMTDNGTWDTFTLTNGVGTLPGNGAAVAVLFIPKGDLGNTGSTGATGAAGGAITIPYTFSTTTTDSDPGNGVLRLDNATQNAATIIRADLLDANGTDVTAVLNTFDDSTATVKGQARLFKASDTTAYIIFNVTALATPAGYRNITVAVLAASATNPFSNSDALYLTFVRTGDAGGGPASGITFTPTGTVSATDVQAAIAEVDSEKVSANDAQLTGTTNISQAYQVSGDITPSQITADQNDYNPTGWPTASVMRLSTDASRTISGLQGGVDGRIMMLINIGTNNIILSNENALSAAANRFQFSSDIIVRGSEAIDLYYDSTTQRWRAIEPAVSAGHMYVSATDRLLGRSTAGAGSAEEITCTAAARSILDDASVAAIRTTLDTPAYADVRHTSAGKLTFVSATQIKFGPYKGNKVQIAGVLYDIPSAGVLGSNSGLSSSTTYYVYVWNNSGTLTIEFSTTTHVPDTTAGNIGVEIKSGDNSRSLIGMVRIGGGGTFLTTGDTAYVRSWFNCSPVDYFGTPTAGVSTSFTGGFSGIGSDISFLAWAGETIDFIATGFTLNNTGSLFSATNFAGIMVDGGVVGNTAQAGSGLNVTVGMSLSYFTTFSEGLHTANIGAFVSTGTGSFYMQLRAMLGGI